MGRNKNPFLVGERFFLSAVEKICDMSILFRFGDPQLVKAGPAHDFSQAICDRNGGKCDSNREIIFILGKTNKFQVGKIFFSFYFGESGKDKSFGELSRAIFPEIEKNDGIIFFDYANFAFSVID